MPVTLTFDPNSSLTVSDMTNLVELVAFETPLENITTTSFSGTGVRYTGPGQPYGMDATFVATGTGFQYVTLGNSFLYAGVVETVTVTHQGTDITMTNMNFDMVTLLPILLAETNQTNILALENFMFQQDWDITLSNNADIAPAGSIVADSAVFNLLGDDIIRGMGGDDDLFAGDGNDQLFGGADNDRLNGGLGNDRVAGGSGDDIVLGAAGDDDISGDDGNDRVNGGSGNDTVTGGAGDDVVVGGYGNDLTYGEVGGDRIYGGRGQDRLMGGDGLDRLYGGSSRDILGGGDDRDILNGGLGHDSLYGGDGWDLLLGHQGDDFLVGGTGNDDFIFRDGDGHDTIRDFDATSNAEDIILRGVTEITSYSDLSTNHMSQVGTSVVIDDGAGMTITLLNVDIADLGAGDFLF